MTLVSILIPSYNGWSHLRSCLQSLRAQNYPAAEIIVINNGSSDNTALGVQTEFPEARLINLPENRGYVGGILEGAKHGRGDYWLCLNDDTQVDKNFLSELVSVMDREPRVGVCFGKIWLSGQENDSTPIYDAFGSHLTWTGFLIHEGFNERDLGQYDQRKELFSPKGACFLIRKTVVTDLGLFDPDYFAYFEESDFFWRTWLSGWTIRFVPSSIVYHQPGSTSKKLNSFTIDFHSFKNRIRSILKNAGTKTAFFMLPSHLFICLALAFLYAARGQGSNSMAILKAIGWNIKHLPETLMLRKKIQAARRVSDAVIFRQLAKPIPFKKTLAFVGVYLKRW